ncbi:MAG: hypothetical protein IJN77_08975 [Oscillospiraceae bacterium]|nr:hypothetical protein [Oscillospiraceae bacterium]
MLTYKIYKISTTTTAMVLDISEHGIDEYITANIISICEGDSDTDIDTIKIRLSDYLLSKTYNQRKGAVAEFYIHLFFRQLGYKQEFLYLNLEENSIKKGFDGYYTYNNEEWIIESKSGDDTSHSSKITAAYSDLKEKLTTKVKNNPWENAYNHASHGAVKTDKSLIKKLKQLSNNYIKGIRLPITEYNLVPCGTVFNHDATDDVIKDTIYKSIKDLHTSMPAGKLMILAISNRAYIKFLEYIGIE